MPTHATVFQQSSPESNAPEAPSASGVGQSSPSQQLPAHLKRPVRIFLLGTCAAEFLLIIPNLLAEIHLESSLHVLIVRALLSVTRLSSVLVPYLVRLAGRWGERAQRRVDSWSMALCGVVCGRVELSRGIATALAAWYLISTPMHDAFGAGPDSQPLPGEGAQPENDTRAKLEENEPGLLAPFAALMAVNVMLFLCDALMLTVAPLLQSGESPIQVQHFEHAQTFRYGDPDVEAARGKFSPTCVVCIADFEVEETVAQLPCGHVFHSECIGEWLARHHGCPLRCPGDVLPPQDETPASRTSRGLQSAISIGSSLDGSRRGEPSDEATDAVRITHAGTVTGPSLQVDHDTTLPSAVSSTVA